MGNNCSFWGQTWPPATGWDIPPHPRNKGLGYNFPTCSDELLDWCLQASKIVDIYLKRRAKKQENDKEESRIFPSVVFVPYVLQDSKSDLVDLCSMKRLDRMKFFGENVIIAAMVAEHPPAIITLSWFVNLRQILLRYFDVIKALRTDYQNDSKEVCSICQGDESKLLVLSCSHGLCEECYSRWVCNELSCPFCREHFPKRSVHKNQWEMLEWQPKDLFNDVLVLEDIVENHCKELDFSETSVNLLQVYDKIERLLFVHEKDGILIVDKNRK